MVSGRCGGQLGIELPQAAGGAVPGIDESLAAGVSRALSLKRSKAASGM